MLINVFALLLQGDDPLIDLFAQPSTAEYLVCTKSGSSEKANPVVGFSLYHEPTSIVSLLADGQLVTLALITTAPLPALEDLGDNAIEELNSPLKKVVFRQTLRIRFVIVLIQIADAARAIRHVYSKNLEASEPTAHSKVATRFRKVAARKLRGISTTYDARKTCETFLINSSFCKEHQRFLGKNISSTTIKHEKR